MNYYKKKNFLKEPEKTSSFFDLTPMIDIVFILLVFFILTANVAQNVFDLTLPSSDENYKEDLKEEGEQVKVTLFATGEFAINEVKFQDYSKFKNEIIKIYKTKPDTQFLLISEANLSVEKLMLLLTFLKANEITKIDILLKK